MGPTADASPPARFPANSVRLPDARAGVRRSTAALPASAAGSGAP